ncbi:helix-turn-helix domain-containing protein [Peterkaempfera sp. SMS 1(5)a]|uniref:AraC family transcriptional regulator n=1 Tax=Peterkaempfera podocarpi TaxID=3232308 RepID=UPI00366D51DF
MPELGLADTNGILSQPWVSPRRTSSGLGWEHLYVSTQSERPYRAQFEPASTHLLILHLSGPVTVSRGRGRSARSGVVPAGGLFLQPAQEDLAVELRGDLETVHAYLTDHALCEANDSRPIRLAEKTGTRDPLLEQLLLALDGVLQRWEPSARTYVDHLTGMLAAQLAHAHPVEQAASGKAARSGLTQRQLASVRELMEGRIAAPVPLTELAAAASLSVSQFTRQFRASTGESPHQCLLRLRLEHACRLLRTSSSSIPEVALQCGFSHQEHLTRVMRTKLGTTPAALRRAR